MGFKLVNTVDKWQLPNCVPATGRASALQPERLAEKVSLIVVRLRDAAFPKSEWRMNQQGPADITAQLRHAAPPACGLTEKYLSEKKSTDSQGSQMAGLRTRFARLCSLNRRFGKPCVVISGLCLTAVTLPTVSPTGVCRVQSNAILTLPTSR